jgi:hypothetical protein
VVPRSMDLIQTDCYLWESLKATVYEIPQTSKKWIKIFNCVLQETLKELITVFYQTWENELMHALMIVLDISGSQFCVHVLISTQGFDKYCIFNIWVLRLFAYSLRNKIQSCNILFLNYLMFRVSISHLFAN